MDDQLKKTSSNSSNKPSFLSDESDEGVSHVKHIKENGLSAKPESDTKPDFEINLSDAQNINSDQNNSFESAFIGGNQSVESEITSDKRPASLNLADIKNEEDSKPATTFADSANTISVSETEAPFAAPVDNSALTTTSQDQETTSPKNEIHVGDKQPKEKREMPGLGCFKSVFLTLFDCLGCLLFIISIAIVLFVYLANSY